MTVVTLTVWVSAFASFGWGMLRFFRKSRRLEWNTGLVATLGLAFSGWHAWAIAIAPCTTIRGVAGVALLLLSIALFWRAVRAHRAGAFGTDAAPTAIFEHDLPGRLVSDGPYRYIRHPFYASYTMFWVAGGLLSGSFAALVPAVVMLGIYLEAIRQEERKFAASPLAAAYAEYRRRTGAMIPSSPWWKSGVAPRRVRRPAGKA